MPHLFETAPTGRAKCRGCGEKIAQGELRFGESLPNPFAEGETTHWFHPDCGAYKRPEPFLAALADQSQPLPDQERLRAAAQAGVDHRRLPRIDGAERAPTGRAQCRQCRQTIPKDAWRIGLVFWEEGRFNPAGYVHVRCAPAYFETAEVIARVRRFGRGLGEEDLKGIEAELADATAAGR